MSVIDAAGYTIWDYPNLGLDYPVLAWVVNQPAGTTFVADQEATNFPAYNLQNPATNLKWAGNTTAVQYVTITYPSLQYINYCAIAFQNFWYSNIQVSVETDTGGGTFVSQTTPVVPTYGPIIFRLPFAQLARLRVKFSTGTQAPSCAVIQTGLLITMERPVYAGFTPMLYWPDWRATNGMSETGHFLGRLVLSRSFKTKFEFKLISPAFWRNTMYNAVQGYGDRPMFFAWKPQTYPTETGYGWLTAMPVPVPQPPSNLLSFNLEMNGVL